MIFGHCCNKTFEYCFLSRKTIPLRDKEAKQDYRFMPEPNLPPLVLMDDDERPMKHRQGLVSVSALRALLPELPAGLRSRLIQNYNLRPDLVATLVKEDGLMEYFEEVIEVGKQDPKIVINWVMNNLLGVLNECGLSVSQSPIKPGALAELINLQINGIISSSVAKKVFAMMWKDNESRSPVKIVAESGWGIICDPVQLEAACIDIIAKHPKQCDDPRCLLPRLPPRLLSSTITMHQGLPETRRVQRVT
uniref:Asn/Gln amidotransferase domain-containing protein n=1 Tax=Eptatretus burgeri TaxID=7764 RepID=A0A8C4Q211_EPTBU